MTPTQHCPPPIPLRSRVACRTLVVLWPALTLCAPVSAQQNAQLSAPAVRRGQVVFETICVACHALDIHRAGPSLRGVVGRVAGKAPDFFYSDALESATHVWDRAKLKAWLTNPETLVPGQEMNFHLDSARDRDDVVAYLASLPKRAPN